MTEPRTMDCETVRELAPLYVLGVLEPDEAAAVREHVAGCDDVHAELEELAGAAGSLLLAAEPVEPPAALKSRLLAAADADLREGRHPSTAATTAAAASPAAVPPVAPTVARPTPVPPVETPRPVTPAPRTAPISLEVERERRRFRWATIGAAAAIILAVALGGYALTLRGQLADEA